MNGGKCPLLPPAPPQAIERHRLLLSPGERRSFVEDLDDLESEVYDIEQKLLVLQRIYRTQPTLLAATGPRGRWGDAMHLRHRR